MPVETYLEEKSFFFETAATSPSTKKPYAFNLVRFTGSEALSRPYEFDITISTKDHEVDLNLMLENPCVLYLRPGHKLPVHGILSTFEQLNEVDGNLFFRAVLVPKLWQLSLYDVSEVYLDMTVPQVIEQVLKEGGLGGADYELKLVRTYRTWSFICQYQETHLDFISRWMEREGIFYFFEQTDAGEKLIISDTSMVHVDLPDEKTVHYSPPSGMEISAQKEAITNFICRQVPVPKKVTLQDFNYRKSPPNVKGEAEVSSSGRGEVLIYGEHVKNNHEATEYAKLRAEEILCRQRVYLGEGTAAFLRVGYFFNVDRHYQKAFNRSYLLMRLEHAGSQAALLMAGVGVTLSNDEQRPYYRNTFEALENDLQFRPERTTPKPRFYGTINAKVEAEGDGKYAELDEFGRYKVKLPFDRTDRLGQKASRWIRMAQPFAGPDEGMHFPLRKGAEVLLTFMDGDPDRPIISSAVPGAEGQSPVVDENSSKNLITTSGGNYMHFEDLAGKQRILMSSPTSNSWMRIGAPNDPPDPYVVSEGDELAKISDTDGEWKLTKIGASVITNNTRKAQLGHDNKKAKYELIKKEYIFRHGTTYDILNVSIEDNLTTNDTPVVGQTYTINGIPNSLVAAPALADTEIKSWSFVQFTAVNRFVQRNGANYDVVTSTVKKNLATGTAPAVGSSHTIDGKDWKLRDAPTLADGEIKLWTFYHEKETTLRVKADVAQVDEVKGDGIRIRSTDNVWIEADNRYATYMIGGPSAADRDTKVPEKVKYLWDKFYGSSPAFNPTGMQAYNYGDDVPNPVSAADLASMSALARRGKVQLTMGDTFNTQDGNIYDFGGYWNYNLGNSYLEQHMSQSGVTLNKKQEYDAADKGGPGYSQITDITSHGSNVWVSKKIGAEDARIASYDYVSCLDAVVVANHNHTYTHKYNDYSYETQYCDGEKFGAKENDDSTGITTEWAWSGASVYKYETTNDQIDTTNSFKWGMSAKAEASFSLGTAISFKFEGDLSLAVSLSINLKAEIEIANGFMLKLSTGLAMEIELDLKLGTGVEIDKDGSLAFKAVGFKARKDALVEARKAEVRLKRLEADIDSNAMMIENNQLGVEQAVASIHSAMEFHGL